ncbi:protein phosphatase 2C domain-containing protein [Candidatus Saccharibacteria bacterium]|nr:protein phosphatase 2C domain-containing protein [Candidatus Saccharibacteria bacterium]
MAKSINISKIGADHLFYGKNRQDFVINLPGFKIVLDGCGSMPFSEVGVSLFGQLLAKRSQDLNVNNFEQVVDGIFTQLTNLSPESDEFCLDNLCFTILACFELDHTWVVKVCGDGFILLHQANRVDYVPLDDGKYPRYYAYNYIRDKTLLLQYANGVDFTTFSFSKIGFSNIGVASDGLRFVYDLALDEQVEFQKRLLSGKSGKLSMLINRNQAVFKDDISICF